MTSSNITWSQNCPVYNDSANQNETATDYIRIVNHIKFYILILIIIVGIIGNSLSIFVFIKSRLGLGTVGQYLISLAFAGK